MHEETFVASVKCVAASEERRVAGANPRCAPSVIPQVDDREIESLTVTAPAFLVLLRLCSCFSPPASATLAVTAAAIVSEERESLK